MKRIFLFLITNIAVLVTLGIVANLLCAFLYGTSVEQVIGPEWTVLLVYAFVYGMLGAFISLLFSKPIAKMSCGARTIDGTEGEAERWLVTTVEDLARQAGVKTPEVAIYEGAANAFATGAFKNSALVAVSTDIMRQMTKEELRAVLGHEMSHVSNGDMVTLTLVQGVLNAFVIVVSRVLASVIANGSKGESRRNNNGLYFLLVMVLQIALGIPRKRHGIRLRLRPSFKNECNRQIAKHKSRTPISHFHFRAIAHDVNHLGRRRVRRDRNVPRSTRERIPTGNDDLTIAAEAVALARLRIAQDRVELQSVEHRRQC